MKPTTLACAATWLLAAFAVGCRTEPEPAPQPVAAVPSVQAAPAANATAPCAPAIIRQVGPASAPATTTLVLLHGYGSNSADLEPVAQRLAAVDPHLVALVPDACDAMPGQPGQPPGARQWWALDETSDRSTAVNRAGDRVSRFVAAEIARRGLPHDRVVWAGFSQGAMLAEWEAVHGSPRPLGAIAFSGRYDDTSPVGAPVGTPVLLIHGTLDRRIPFEEAARAEQALALRGAKVERVSIDGMRHAINDEAERAAATFLARILAAK